MKPFGGGHCVDELWPGDMVVALARDPWVIGEPSGRVLAVRGSRAVVEWDAAPEPLNCVDLDRVRVRHQGRCPVAFAPGDRVTTLRDGLGYAAGMEGRVIAVRADGWVVFTLDTQTDHVGRARRWALRKR